jgi:hypothetical protein
MEKCAFLRPNPYYNEWERENNVVGCGLLLDTDNKWSIFFTANGKHCGQLFIIVAYANSN